MKIAVKVTVEMTPEQAELYASCNGVSLDEIRSDVRLYVRTELQDAGAFCDGQAEVSVTL